MQLLVQQQAMSQLIRSQLNMQKIPRDGADSPQSSAVRDGNNPAIRNGEQVAEWRTLVQGIPLGQLKPTTDEELEALLGEIGPPFPDHVMQA